MLKGDGMTGGTLTHPSPEQLAAFGAGRLRDEESVSVEAHLAECAECCQWLNQEPGDDSYVRLLRAAAESVAVSSSPTLATTSTDTNSGELPKSLKDHPRYRVIRLLGSGGMGQVFEAEHRLMRRRVALKIIKPQWLSSPEAVARFRREVRAAAKLVHPHVVTAFDAEQAGDVHFLAMEFVNGITLAQLVDQRRPIPVSMACGFIGEAALGLRHAHEVGMVHRDIKPANLMLSFEVDGEDRDAWRHILDGEATVKILDFGLARFGSEQIELGSETSANVLLGTPDFMAPEQARDARSADIRSDIYSLGCTLHFLLTSEVPHPGCGSHVERALAHIERDPQPLSKFREDIPVGLQSVLQRMMAKSPAERFQTPKEVVAALAPFTNAGQAVPRSLMSSHELPHRPLAAGAKRVLMATALVGFVAVMAVVVHVITDKGDLRVWSEVGGEWLLLRQNGQAVRLIEVRPGTTTARLLSGEYVLELRDSANASRVQPKSILMKRGTVFDVRVIARDVDGNQN